MVGVRRGADSLAMEVDGWLLSVCVAFFRTLGRRSEDLCLERRRSRISDALDFLQFCSSLFPFLLY
jgi:hypothetical protein